MQRSFCSLIELPGFVKTGGQTKAFNFIELVI